MKRQLMWVACVLGAWAGAGCSDQAPGTEAMVALSRPAGAATAAMMLDISRLAADSMNGRAAGTADERRAASYIAQRFDDIGLTQISSRRFQDFPLRNEAASQNVVGALKGRGALAGQWLIVGSHYDHLGRHNGEVYNGADDNASGLAVLLAVAESLKSYASENSEARRSILFVAFGGEEAGLVGSEYYASRPLIPLHSTVAMFNFDMVGRMRENTLYLGGRGTAVEWNAIVEQSNLDRLSLLEKECTGCSDFAPFSRNGIPVLALFTGLHADYHRPTDDASAISESSLAAVSDFALRVIRQTATRSKPLTWQ